MSDTPGSTSDNSTSATLPESAPDFRSPKQFPTSERNPLSGFDAVVPDAPADLQELRQWQLKFSALAREARDSFGIAISPRSDASTSEAAMHAVKTSLDSLWEIAHIRDVQFQDLLGLIDVAISRKDIVDLDQAKRSAIHSALRSLAAPFIDFRDLDAHSRELTEAGVDLMAPLNPSVNLRIEIQVEQ